MAEHSIVLLYSVPDESHGAAGLETPDAIDLRKDAGKGGQQALFQVLEQKENRVGSQGLMGSSHT